MIRPPHLCIAGRFVPFKATRFHHAPNTVSRILSQTYGDNDNPWFGGRSA